MEMKGTRLNQEHSNDLSEEDKKDINEMFSERKGFSVKGKEVCLTTDFPIYKHEAGMYLSVLLRDEENLAYYEMLAKKRRLDFLKNCLKKTLLAKHMGIIKKTMGAYFTGVVKYQTAAQKRLEAYKRKHTSLYGYSNNNDKNE